MMFYTVYASQVEEVKKRLGRLARKAVKYNVPFSYSIGEEHPQDVAVREADPITQTIQTVATYTVAAVDICIECEELIRANRWTVRARVEHGDKGNIVTGIGPQPIRSEWYNAAANCDHCKSKRQRAITFFCENEEGAICQVGRSCLKDYTGIFPGAAAIWAEVQDVLVNDMSCTKSEWLGLCRHRMFSVEEVLAHACDAIRESGYRKSSEPNSTRDTVEARTTADTAPSAEGKENARDIISWLTGLDSVVRAEDAAINAAWKRAEETGDEQHRITACKLDNGRTGNLERNCIPLALSGYCKASHLGLLAYMPVAYEQWQEREARKKQRELDREMATASDYVGHVGDRITLRTKDARLLTSWETKYGVTYLYRFTDSDGNVFIWKASRSQNIEDAMMLKGTVKEHSEYDGVKQTVITRVKRMDERKDG